MSNDPIKDFNDTKISGFNWDHSVAGAIGAAAKAREEDERSQREQEEQHQNFLKQREINARKDNKEIAKTGGSGVKDLLTFIGFILGFSLLPDVLHLPKESLSPWILGGICAVMVRLTVTLLAFLANLAMTLVSLILMAALVIGVIQAVFGKLSL